MFPLVSRAQPPPSGDFAFVRSTQSVTGRIESGTLSASSSVIAPPRDPAVCHLLHDDGSATLHVLSSAFGSNPPMQSPFEEMLACWIDALRSGSTTTFVGS